jgi:peptidoglycan/xylan/chitin deacetylase (PgdA/CDA1 family)
VRHGAALRLSVALHVAAPIALALAPPLWPWILGSVLADHLLLLWGSLVPRSRVLGRNLRRLAPAVADGVVALSFDDGPDPEATPQVLRILRERGARASFFCIGRRAEAHPELIAAIVDGGHAVENHTWGHPKTFCFGTPRRLAREVDRAQESLSRLAGSAPRYFRAPAGLRNPWLDPLLAARGLGLASWTRRGFDTVTSDPERVRARLVCRLRAGDVLLLHDGGSRRARSGRPVVLDVLGPLLDELARRGLRVVAIPRERAETGRVAAALR